jgi:hypothetical protein
MFFRKRHISHASRAKKKCTKIRNPFRNGQKLDKTPCPIPGGCTMGIIFCGHVIDNIAKRITIQELNQSLK